MEDRVRDITKRLPDAKLIGVCDGSVTLETDIHNALSEHKLNNEWYKINSTTVALIKAFVPNVDFADFGKVNSRLEAAKKTKY